MKNIDILIKIAKVHLNDIEYHTGYLKGKDKIETEKLLKNENKKSLGLKHPILTGIPTLGIWPAISHGNATNKIVETLGRKSRKMEERIDKKRFMNNIGDLSDSVSDLKYYKYK